MTEREISDIRRKIKARLDVAYSFPYSNFGPEQRETIRAAMKLRAGVLEAILKVLDSDEARNLYQPTIESITDMV